jgi:short-subunit dehydrogenase
MKGSSGMSPEAVVNCAFKALARRRSLIVPGCLNKAYTFLGARMSKSFSARVAAKILSRRSHRLP